jgi:hypothetical protein
MIHYKWEILQAKLFYVTRDRDGEIKKTAGDKNVWE